MSAQHFLDTLSRHGLDEFYPNFSTEGITQLESFIELSVQDYANYGIKSADDKRKFVALAQTLKKEGIRPASNEKSPLPQKRSSSVARLNAFTPPEKQARRLTLGGENLTRSPIKTPPSRRLSFIPKSGSPRKILSPARHSPISHKSPNKVKTPPRVARTTVQIQQASKSVSFSPTKDKLFQLENSSDDEEELKKTVAAPILDTYGIPTTSSRSGNYSKINGNVNKSQASLATSGSSDLNQRIRVCVRKRPLSRREVAAGERDITPVAGARSINVNAPKVKLDLTRFTEQHSFTFDEVFDSSITNAQIYQRTAKPLVQYIFTGGKATCFAYGQTGSGKTYTMLDQGRGLYVQAAQDIFAMLAREEYAHLSAWVGFYEIYQGHLYDLLNDRKRLIPRDDGNNNVVISGLKEFAIADVDRLFKVFDHGSQARTTGKTGANNNSSRSHAVLQILLKPKKNSSVIAGKLSFIDLAGSERGADRGDANTKTRMEGAEINKSLLALKECIRALDQDSRHTPFRGSKLTQVLRDSFVGNSRTCMIATISPNGSNSEHTLNTLRYADRVKELKGEQDGGGSFMEDDLQDDFQVMAEQTTGSTEATDGNSPVQDKADTEEEQVLQADGQENIFDEDFPQEGTKNELLATPTSQRIQTQSMGTPQRRQHYLRRLSSPTDQVLNDLSLTTNADSSTKPSWPYSHRSPPPPSERPNNDQMLDFVKLHRAQIREITECSKKETKLLATFSLGLSSTQHYADDEAVANNEKILEEFEQYLGDLDELLQRKVACAEALRDKMRQLLGDDVL
ncbi:P-loop containing nucleoside triphosphate hydrolase protein [Umbelopsis sp. AD052]|nr:P-loop containing nucleoside triphosphate hydrolase protein [Umbelopsis sp. AD052]